MSFTPGPWFVSGVRFKMNGGEWLSVNRYDESKKKDENIACVGFDPRTGAGWDDAHRIVTAVNAFDDMKAALQVIRQQWAGHSEICAAVTSSNRNKCDCDWPKIAAQCDAALTKAQGQEVAPDGRASSNQQAAQ